MGKPSVKAAENFFKSENADILGMVFLVATLKEFLLVWAKKKLDREGQVRRYLSGLRSGLSLADQLIYACEL